MKIKLILTLAAVAAAVAWIPAAHGISEFERKLAELSQPTIPGPARHKEPHRVNQSGGDNGQQIFDGIFAQFLRDELAKDCTKQEPLMRPAKPGVSFDSIGDGHTFQENYKFVFGRPVPNCHSHNFYGMEVGQTTWVEPLAGPPTVTAAIYWTPQGWNKNDAVNSAKPLNWQGPAAIAAGVAATYAAWQMFNKIRPYIPLVA